MSRQPLILAPGEGRSYDMGDRMSAVFKADGDETDSAYAISEWWLEPHTAGPGPHSHPDDDVFFVLAGTLHLFVGDDWVTASTGAFVLVPGGTTHDFANRGDERAGFLDISVPGGFEHNMPSIADWFRTRSPQDSRA